MNVIRFAVTVVLFACLHGINASSAQAIAPRVTAEEDVYTLVSPNNGSGPFWSYGCTTILRLGDRVIVSEMETGKDVPLLANTRWRLFERTATGWQLLAEPEGYRQREPGVLATAWPNTVFLNVNDSVMPPGTMYGKCEPALLAYDLSKPAPLAPRKISPKWAGEPNFTDHSYRGYAADAGAHRILMLNIDAKTSEEHFCLLTAEGETLKTGSISFPIRSCYPQVALNGNQAHVLAISDIVEPVEEWRKYKFEKTQREWDYVFRILYYTHTGDIMAQNFVPPIEIANVDATGGYINNQDLWIAPNGDAYILYTQSEVGSELIRDKYFPGKSTVPTLFLAIVHDGALADRRVLLEGSPTAIPSTSRFHVTTDGSVYVLSYIGGKDSGNYLQKIYPELRAERFPVSFKSPFTTFLLANTRAGNAPNKTIDLVGHQSDGTKIAYGQIVLE
jgi:hypothetical protein